MRFAVRGRGKRVSSSGTTQQQYVYHSLVGTLAKAKKAVIFGRKAESGNWTAACLVTRPCGCARVCRCAGVCIPIRNAQQKAPIYLYMHEISRFPPFARRERWKKYIYSQRGYTLLSCYIGDWSLLGVCYLPEKKKKWCVCSSVQPLKRAERASPKPQKERASQNADPYLSKLHFFYTYLFDDEDLTTKKARQVEPLTSQQQCSEADTLPIHIHTHQPRAARCVGVGY